MQAKQKNIESELNDAKTELAEIKLRQQELEARNRLLEKVAELSKAHTTERAEPSLMEVCSATLQFSLLLGMMHAKFPQCQLCPVLWSSGMGVSVLQVTCHT